MKVYHLLLLSILFACTESNESIEQDEYSSNMETPESGKFSDFTSKIPAYSYPVQMSCSFDNPAFNTDFSEYDHYFPHGGRLVAKLNSTSEYSLIIFDFACDYSCPTLYSFDQKGTRIDSISLTQGQCAEDPYMKSKQWFTILENIQISLVDTTKHFGTTEKLDSTVIQNQSYKFNSDGKFEFVSKQSKIIRKDSTTIIGVEN